VTCTTSTVNTGPLYGSLQSAYVLSGASVTLGAHPVSNGIITGSDNLATPTTPNFEMIAFPTP
jgi:hypothetical protein